MEEELLLPNLLLTISLGSVTSHIFYKRPEAKLSHRLILTKHVDAISALVLRFLHACYHLKPGVAFCSNPSWLSQFPAII